MEKNKTIDGMMIELDEDNIVDIFQDKNSGKIVELLTEIKEISNKPITIDGISVITLKGDKGDSIKGDAYNLTEKDKKEIASIVKVPIVEKVIEKIETIREQPIVTNEIKEVAVTDEPDTIVDKVNKAKNLIDPKKVKGVPELIKYVNELPNGQGSSGTNPISVLSSGTLSPARRPARRPTDRRQGTEDWHRGLLHRP